MVLLVRLKFNLKKKIKNYNKFILQFVFHMNMALLRTPKKKIAECPGDYFTGLNLTKHLYYLYFILYYKIAFHVQGFAKFSNCIHQIRFYVKTA